MNERSHTKLTMHVMGLLQTAQMLHEKGWLPEVVMSSNSERTRQTLEAMREAVDAFRYRVFLQQCEGNACQAAPTYALMLLCDSRHHLAHAKGALPHTLQCSLCAVYSCKYNKLQAYK